MMVTQLSLLPDRLFSSNYYSQTTVEPIFKGKNILDKYEIH